MKVLYFSWLRERLNRGEEEVAPPAEVTDVAGLIDWLAGRDEAVALAFEKRSIIRAAVDGRLAGPQTPVTAAATVAFFPPMTGG